MKRVSPGELVTWDGSRCPNARRQFGLVLASAGDYKHVTVLWGEGAPDVITYEMFVHLLVLA